MERKKTVRTESLRVNLAAFMVALLTLVGALATPVPVEAQTGPTLPETVDFIKRNIDGSVVKMAWKQFLPQAGDHGCEFRHEWTYSYKVTTSGTEVALQEVSKYRGMALGRGCPTVPTQEDTQTYKFPFSTIALESLKVHCCGSGIAGVQDELQTAEIAFKFSSPEGTKGVGIRIQEKDLADRLLKAFAHAAELSGAKKDVF